MLGRRSFLIGCGWIAATPALAKALPLSAPINRRRGILGDPAPPEAVVGETPLAGPVLRIDGWEQQSGDGEVWISINQSWRSAWR
jgi:hypothetical protein